MSWGEIEIQEISTKIVSGGTPKSTIKEYYGGNIPWLRTQEVVFKKIYDTGIKITEKGLNNSSAKMIESNCVIIAMYGNSAGRVGLNKIPLSTNQACCNVKIDKAKADEIFVFYNLLSRYDELKSLSRGAAQSNLNSDDIKKFVIPYPPLETQKRIADILSAYDDLIENNLKRIKLLEQAAKNIYKEWFVNMRFPGYENTPTDQETGLPEGWAIKRSDEIFKINIGKTPPRKETEWFSFEEGYKWVSISDMNKSKVFIQKTKERITDSGVRKFNVKIVPKGTVLLSFKLTIGSVVIATEDMVTNEAIAHFNIDDNTFLSSEYTYCYLSSFAYKTLGSTSSIGQALNSKIVKSIPMLLPHQDLVTLFTKKVTPIFIQLENLITQNQKLKSARDILLPRLMKQTIQV